MDAVQVRATDLGGAVTHFWVSVKIDLPNSGSPSERSTFLLSRSLTGGFPNGPSRAAAISHDQRIASLMAYESDASDIAPRDSNGMTDVFLVRRARPWGTDGTPWTPGATELLSKGMGGVPANGRSFGPAVDGDAHHSPHCVAFVSQASNLVPHDTNGVADAFVKDISTGRIQRVSLGARGGQANAPTSSVTVDGRCRRLAFVSSATNIAPRTRRAIPRAFARDTGSAETKLVSASRSGRPADGPVLSAEISRNGRWVAFDSQATNLVPADRAGGSDVYRRALDSGRIDLVSRNAAGHPGNGPSTNPSITDVGTYVAYETRATDIIPGDSGDGPDVVRTRVGRSMRHQAVSRDGNGASSRPSISGAGEFVLFDSEASNFKQAANSKDTNAARDVFLWNKPTGNISRESRTPDNGPIFGPSDHAQTSSRGNYVAFESPSLLVDTALLDQFSPGWSTNFQKRSALVAQGQTDQTRQVYLRYLGPK